MIYILSQILVLITYILLGATYFIKDRKWLLVVSLIAIATNTTSYFFLKAWAGVMTTILALVRNIVFLIQNKDKKDKINFNDWVILSVYMIILSVIAVITYDGFFSLFSIVCSLTYTIAVWQRDEKIYKILGIVSSFCSIVYYAYILSIFGLILESILFVVIVVGTIRYFITEKAKKVKNKVIDY